MTEIAIVGAGPYGLSIAAHLRAQGIPFRIFGRTMDSWLSHMPKSMCLKSEGFASNLSDPKDEFTLEKFCAEKGIQYAHVHVPVKLQTFTSYGQAFRDRMVPELEEKLVSHIERMKDGFRLRLENGEELAARRVILAVGITHYAWTPEVLADLPSELVSHSFHQAGQDKFKGKSVVVVGGGSSATDLAAELYESGANVQLIARQKEMIFHSAPQIGKKRPLWKRLRHPQSGLGPSMRSAAFCTFPTLFRLLPASLRVEIVRRHLGPSGTWFTKERIVGKVQIQLGSTIEHAEAKDGRVHLRVRLADGGTREYTADHVIAATGYHVDLDRLKFLSPELNRQIDDLDRTPILSANCETSVPGLYFVGVSAANTFGPMMRFAFGADFTARHITKGLVKAMAGRPVSVGAAKAVPAEK
jgi:cation diffusion facilitator CzcD-associated flavoprotein CzcO